MRPLLPVLMCFLLCSCAIPVKSNSINSRYSLQDSRNARLHVKVVETVPATAIVMDKAGVERCHKYLGDEPPSDLTMTDDMKLMAYSQGADGIADLQITRESGLLSNCWSMVKASGTLFRFQ